MGRTGGLGGSSRKTSWLMLVSDQLGSVQLL
jgi:hypothetical protein